MRGYLDSHAGTSVARYGATVSAVTTTDHQRRIIEYVMACSQLMKCGVFNPWTLSSCQFAYGPVHVLRFLPKRRMVTEVTGEPARSAVAVGRVLILVEYVVAAYSGPYFGEFPLD